MLMADDNSNSWFPDDLTTGVGDDGAWDELCIDLDSFLDILGETPDPSQHGQDNPSLKDNASLNLINMPQGESGLPNSERASSLREELPGSVTVSPSNNSEASDSRTGGSDGSFEPVGNFHINMVPPKQSGSPVHSTASLTDWMLPLSGHGSPHSDRDIVSQEDDNKYTQYKRLNYSAPFCLPVGYVNNVLDDRGPLKFNNLKDETECQFRYSKEDDAHCQYSSHNQSMEKSDISCRNFYNSIANNSKMLGSPKTEDTSFMNVDIPDNKSLAKQFCLRSDGSLYSGPSSNIFPDSIDFLSLPNVLKKKFVSDKNEVAIDLNGEGGQVPSQDAYSDRAITFEAHGGSVGGKEGLVAGNLGLSGPYHSLELDDHILPEGRYCFDELSNMPLFDDTLAWSVQPTPPNMSSEKNHAFVKYESDGEVVASQSEVVNNAAGDDPFIGKSDVRDENEDIYVIDDSKRVCRSLGIIDGTAFRSSAPGADEHPLDLRLPAIQPSASVRNHLECPKGERESTKRLEHVSANCHEIPSNNLAQVSHFDDDLDICILENLSEPYRNLSPVNGKSLVTQRSTLSEPINHVVGSVKLKANDERFIFRVALQDLSQPKSEATPPDGVLSVPLLRHQRIALSWMVNKETASLHCSGGILADDQGLGKTISTIALILKERSPCSNACVIEKKQNEMETLNLDEDDDVMPDFDGSKQGAECCQVLTNGSSTKGGNTTVKVKGRPAAGTLIVCPTSVLRQWSEELQNKVTCKANLSVLVYHGSGRTKDPFELAKYDVVLTTYAIVSMEVPKQPLVDEDDDETGKQSQDPLVGVQSSKKRKYPPNCERPPKGKKGLNCELLDTIARPLASVRWFRVVLDEAQSIKNYRTQVARACWGLRAKRRWCLSGTPIQNAVDDLYSYFRFLRYDPYATYKSFCATIKVPIQKNPTNGYKKLQAVLKTIMLRRTKGTKIDGESIVNLPPKTVILKKVEFTQEERDFYCRLEADSRAQFAEYAAAGTVKQNYVNILLMLLRLRQACDHPLLVRGYKTGFVLRSSIETAKKLPLEKRVSLLNCLEASLAICGICNDPPEDAIVTGCGHVFCNQCICEHLTGDDNQCPSPKCKTRLSVSCLFSGASLRNSLSEGSVQDSFPHSGLSVKSDSIESGPAVTELLKSGFENSKPLEAGSVKTKSLESCPLGSSFDSSKIKAAVEVLQFLSKPRDCTPSRNSLRPMNGTADCTNDSSGVSEGKESGVQDNKYMDLNGDSTHLVSVVGEKAIVFSQWTKMLDLLEACLKNSSIQYRRLDGTMSVLARDKAVKDFNTLPEVSVMIMSLKAASLGLNMVAACHVLLLDLWWNPTTEDQAIDRAHRIGQTRPVTVLRLTVKDTVEDRILALQQKKREMVASAFGEDETGSRQSRLTVEDLKYLFMV